MKKIIRLTEQDIEQIVKKVLDEQVPDTRFDTNFFGASNKPKAQISKPNINPLNLKKGDGGRYNPKQVQAVNDLQSKLIQLGLLKTSTGKPTGYFGDLTLKALQRYNDKDYVPGAKQKAPQPSAEPVKSTSAISRLSADQKKVDQAKSKGKPTPGVSSQVNAQLEYLKKNGILGDQEFTILDDKQSKVHTFLPGYKLQKTYFVLTGQDAVRDTEVVNDFWKKVWDASQEDLKSLFKGDFKNFGSYLIKCIGDEGYKEGDWANVTATPSGVFRRASGIIDNLEDYVARKSDELVYGKKYISWENLNGQDLTTAWHGTNIPKRVETLTAKDIEKQSCKKRKMSKGCVGFKESDILEVNDFVDGGQISIWLPSDGKSIVNVPKDIPRMGILQYMF